MEITNTLSLPELIFLGTVAAVLALVAIPNWWDARESHAWTRQQRIFNGDYLSKVRVSETAMQQDRARVVQLSAFLVIGLFFATQPSVSITWRAWVLYGSLVFIALSIGLACIRQRRMRVFVLEETRLRRERDTPAQQERYP